MVELFGLVKRNILVFLRDKTAVFFSLLSVIILIGVYILFLGNNMQSWFNDPTLNTDWVRYLSDSNIMAGVLVVNTITVSLAMFGNMVTDKENGKIKGILVAPINRFKVVLSYIISAWITTFLLTMFLLVLVEVYIVSNGGLFMNFETLLKTVGLIIFNVLTISSFTFFVITFVKSSQAFSTISTIVGTFIGFICGIYMPLKIMPEFVQTLAKFIPFTYNTVLMRQVFTEQAMGLVFENAPAEMISELSDYLGVSNLNLFGLEITAPIMYVFLSISSILLMYLSFVIIKKHKNH